MSEKEKDDHGPAGGVGPSLGLSRCGHIEALEEFQAALIEAEAHFDKGSPKAIREAWRRSLDAVRWLAIRSGMGIEGFGQLAYLHSVLEDLEGGRLDPALKPMDRSGEGWGGRPVTSADRDTDLAMIAAVIDILLQVPLALDEAVQRAHRAAKAGGILPDGMTWKQLKNWRRQIESRGEAARLTRQRILELIEAYPDETRSEVALDLLRRRNL